MSKKETRRAARQAFPGGPPTVQRRDHIRGTKPQPTSKSRQPGAPDLRPPSLKRAVIQGAILAALYFVLIRFIWKGAAATPITYVLFPLVGVRRRTRRSPTGIDRFKYQRRLRKLKGSSK